MADVAHIPDEDLAILSEELGDMLEGQVLDDVTADPACEGAGEVGSDHFCRVCGSNEARFWRDELKEIWRRSAPSPVEGGGDGSTISGPMRKKSTRDAQASQEMPTSLRVSQSHAWSYARVSWCIAKYAPRGSQPRGSFLASPVRRRRLRLPNIQPFMTGGARNDSQREREFHKSFNSLPATEYILAMERRHGRCTRDVVRYIAKLARVLVSASRANLLMHCNPHHESFHQVEYESTIMHISDHISAHRSQSASPRSFLQHGVKVAAE
ncbi:hypothetical protein POSPLADRAFT_1036253 [Postia placenta MAD-698-R-SB12]|uniref:Uncharacterized protein n=1 Tax=Postia placenta MAD-698-R-SB12 TaxID=670580 RepID=A0A1X6MR52_9APHY|nr:hypothetical protein POSPLADRAFT_1036253 [Postia placenta MAD-698-R-SB12]OSX58662.1 hypothetical protein POSPLADRAFT_1036253 [Postia placenta MAD-698-R-SB12]